MNRLTAKDIEQYLDGTWIETDSALTRIIRTWTWTAPRPVGVAMLWRKKQLLEQLAT